MRNSPFSIFVIVRLNPGITGALCSTSSFTSHFFQKAFM